MLKKSTLREIKGSLGRYIAIFAIVALGVGFFSGLKVTREAMITTADDYLEGSRLFDYQVMHTLGFEKEDVTALSKVKGVSGAEGSISIDVLFNTKANNADKVMKLHSVPQEINLLTLEDGRMPKAPNECVVDYRLFNDPIGTKIFISENNEKDTRNTLKYKEYTITGTVVSPYYLNFERGGTSLGNGSVSGFAYIPEEGFDTDYYTEVFLCLNETYPIYTKEYKDLIDRYEDRIEAAVDKQADRRYNEIVDEAKAELADGQKEYDENYQKYLNEKADAEEELADSYQKIIDGQNTLAENKEDLNQKEKELLDAKPQIEQGLAQINQQRQELEPQKPYMTPEQIAQAEGQLNAAETDLNNKMAQIDAGLSQISAGRTEIAKAEKDLEKGLKEYYDGKEKAEKEFADAEAKLADAKEELADARKEIEDIEHPDTYVLDRNTNVGYVSFENDSNIVDGIARVFPIFFFLVAALVCMTTMTRMVDDQRTQIGVLKALGYSDGAVISKYLFYSGSASFLGCIAGFFSCCYIFPQIIWRAYGMMYDFSADLYYIINKPLAITCLLVSLACSMGATLFSCYAEFREVPAQLIRPKAPKDGKRILLERIPFIWNRISFLYKVSFRNIFRYKKRFFMMVLGISGCTALLLTGLGIRDSVKNVVDYQYDEIEVYDYSIIFNKDMTDSRQKNFLKESDSYVEDLIFAHQSSADLVSGSKVKSISLIATSSDNFDDFIKLFDEKDNKISYPDVNEAVVCRKLAEDYNLKPGSKVTLRDENMKEMTLKVSAVCENYVKNYIYISPDTFENQLGYKAEIQTAFVHAKAEDNEQIHSSAAKILGIDNVTTVSVNNDMRERVDSMMKSLDYVIALVVLSAGALAFIVLYNLTNINITERIREIATIKVLGFYPKETSAYVFRENFFLTGISALVGLFLGKILHSFVLSQIRVDMLSFDVRITTLSYVLAVVLTFVFAAVVNLAMYYKLEKISMTESLKSIE